MLVILLQNIVMLVILLQNIVMLVILLQNIFITGSVAASPNPL
jgi:hypothetical protein